MAIRDPAGAGSPIQIVARRTGLTPELLRKWEERYGAVRPARGETGRRLYTDQDIERLSRLKQLTAAGWRISDIAGYDDARLLELLEGIDPAPPGTTPGPGPLPSGRLPQAEELRDALISSAAAFDPAAVTAILERTVLALSVPELLERVVVPALGEIGERWAHGALRCGQEHAVTAVVRTFLGDLLRGLPPAPGAPSIVCGTPSGQAHELGALMAAITAATLGWRTVYLGPGLPAVELAYAAMASEARAVAVSVTWAAEDPALARELRLLANSVPANCVVCVGGNASVHCMPAGGHPRLRLIRSLGDLQRELVRLQSPGPGGAEPSTPPSPSD